MDIRECKRSPESGGEKPVDTSAEFAKTMEKLGYYEYNVEPALEHILQSGLFSAVFDKILRKELRTTVAFDKPRFEYKQQVFQGLDFLLFL